MCGFFSREAQVCHTQPTVVSLPHHPPNVRSATPQPPTEDTCKYSGKKEDFKYIDELISKQACEITDLKNELRALKCQQREELTEMEREMTRKEREYTHQIASLEVELKASEDRYANQVNDTPISLSRC